MTDVKKMNNFLSRYHLPILNEDQESKINRPTTLSEIYTDIKIPEPK